MIFVLITDITFNHDCVDFGGKLHQFYHNSGLNWATYARCQEISCVTRASACHRTLNGNHWHCLLEIPAIIGVTSNITTFYYVCRYFVNTQLTQNVRRTFVFGSLMVRFQRTVWERSGNVGLSYVTGSFFVLFWFVPNEPSGNVLRTLVSPIGLGSFFVLFWFHYDVKSQSFNPGLQYPHLHGPVHTPDNNRWDTPPV